MNLADIIKSKAHATAYFFKQQWGLSQSVEELSKYVIFEGSEAYIKIFWGPYGHMFKGKGTYKSVQCNEEAMSFSTTLEQYEINVSEDEGAGSIDIRYVNRRKPDNLHKTKKYHNYFNKYFDPSTQQDLSDNQANEIKKRNKEIKNELNNIDTLLNDQNNKFDTDLAKSKLDQLKKYQDKMSNNNKSKYKVLEKQQLKKEIEMKRLEQTILELKQELIKKIQDATNNIKQDLKVVNSELQKAQNHRNEIHKENAKKLDNIIKKVEDSIKKADKEFNKAAAEREKYHGKAVKRLEITEVELLKQQKDTNKKLDEAAKNRKEIYESAKAQIEKVEQEVLKSRADANKRLDEAKVDRAAKFADQMKNFSEVKETQQKLQQLTEEGFELAKQDRQKIYALLQEEHKELLKEVQESRAAAKKRFDEAKKERDSYAEKYSTAINQLDASQKQQFIKAFEHRKKIYKDLDDSILKSRAEAKKRFDEAAADRDSKYQSTKAEIEKVEQEIKKLRAKAKEEFNKATTDREAKYQSTKAEIEKVEQEIKKLRARAEKEYDKAAAERKKYHTQTEKTLGITYEKLLEKRLQFDNELNQAQQKLDQVNQETDKMLSDINQKAEQIRIGADANCKKVEQELNKVNQETDKKLSNINQKAEQIRIGADANCKKAEQELNKVNQNTSYALDQMSNQQNNSDLIEYLSEQKNSIAIELEKTLESIRSESHEEILKVKNTNGMKISQEQHEEKRSEHKKHYDKYTELRDNGGDPQSVLEQLEKAIDTAIKLVPNYCQTKEYSFKKDKSGNCDQLRIKNLLKKKYKLEAQIKQSDLDSRINKHLEEIELQNQTLELHVIDQEIFTGDAKSNKLDELLTSLRHSWDSGWNAEIAENMEEADANFAEFRELGEKILKMGALKQEGDSFFNAALEQHKNACNLETSNLALETYVQAMQKYQEGEELDSRFSEWVESCRDMVTAIKEEINNIVNSNHVTEEPIDRFDYIPSNIEEDNPTELIGQVDGST